MGGKCPHRKVKKRRLSGKTSRLDKFQVNGDDDVYDSLKIEACKARGATLRVHFKTNSVEIECVCDWDDENIVETAAISIAPVNGEPKELVILVDAISIAPVNSGPEKFIILVVLKEGLRCKPDKKGEQE
ncbi:hypothetical protein GIB67_032050 [Kingdonia uniflora]|uniref:Uncharacterized protein n=1 Tax=Kingdonia uniflora TaxID=39325 RepID=A0A7J7MWG6_9MAGN|nr:hypothetical protein GIB67_032050 [Kingdonia uniflora]